MRPRLNPLAECSRLVWTTKAGLSYLDNPQAVPDVGFNANDLGADAEPDAQGRITVNPELRRELSLEETQLRMYAYRGRVQILTEAQYEQRRQRASKSAAENVDALERAGLK